MIIRTLHRLGVKTIFSLSGNQIMPLYDACIDAGIRIIHVRHEAAAVFMADAWAQITGELGVAMLTAAPGITNGLAPLYSASQAESPVLLISGDSSVREDGTGAFQELDQVAITRSLTKVSLRPLTVQELYPALDSAVTQALAPRRGPVHLALPFDLMTAETGLEELPAATMKREAAATDTVGLEDLAALVNSAQRPLVLAGPTGARPHMRATREKLEAALGARIIPMESPRGLKDPSLGSLAELMPQADLIVLAGKCLDFTLGFGGPATLGKHARVVVIDADPAMLARASRLLGDRLALTIQGEPYALLAAVQATPAPAERAAWRARVDEAVNNRSAQGVASPASGALGPRALCATVQEFLASVPNPILVCDGGEFGQWAQAYCQAPVRIINGMSGAIGAGICYAIAAKIARPDATVAVLMGDGTAGFHLMELDTAVREQAPVIAVIGNDLRWNAEHLIQMRTYGPQRLIGCELAPTARYHEVASALGGAGFAAHDNDSLATALGMAMNSGLPACINVSLAGEPAPVFSASTQSTTGH
ncbi:thiamine pyrophosphate-binding protein [Achromobacter insolitus]|uniref:thiamine pyrophosphate-binding protein n=1 Tax=Achromobacter insolitus TaxID=217204 RepID=UPI0020A2DB7B|nr:thiamine pyrophosphate-binding protein [Achromobacter insolitus]MCP1405364.1 acetolactate synthase-1/2/3 large subunit [Achromobacter insolitus]